MGGFKVVRQTNKLTDIHLYCKEYSRRKNVERNNKMNLKFYLQIQPIKEIPMLLPVLLLLYLKKKNNYKIIINIMYVCAHVFVHLHLNKSIHFCTIKYLWI